MAAAYGPETMEPKLAGQASEYNTLGKESVTPAWAMASQYNTLGKESSTSACAMTWEYNTSAPALTPGHEPAVRLPLPAA